ncbi:MAG: addiction module protein [Propionibacteriaceae bacterium]|jgi:putative addiction module component (TIGR02574 family)|nr:addiction module protein [Propionibacteriaceae bacterium]
MVSAQLLNEATGLDIADRLELIGAVWDSIDSQDVPSRGERDLIEARAAHMRAHPDESVPWSAVKARLDERFA